MCVAGFEERSLWLDGGRKEEEESKAPQTGPWEHLATKCSAFGRRQCRMAGGGRSAGDPLRQGVDTVTGDPEALSVADDVVGRGHRGVLPEGPSEVLAGAPDLCSAK